MIVICDIDGTLAFINTARIKLLQTGQWEAFAKGVAQDKPIKQIIKIIQMLYQRGMEIHLHTGRGEETRAATEEWLWTYNIPYAKLVMRPTDDLRPDYLLKWSYIRKGGYSRTNVFCAFEDRTKCVQLYRSLGFLCLQVQENTGIDQQTRGNLASVQGLQARVATLAPFTPLAFEPPEAYDRSP